MENQNPMGTLKRAVLFISRKKSRSITLLAIFFTLITLVLMGISIGNAAKNAEENLREIMGGYFKLQTNWESTQRGFITDQLADDIMGSGEIKVCNKMNLLYLMANDLTPIPGRFTSENDSKARLFRILSNTDSSLHEYFYIRAFTLKDGRHIMPEDNNTAVISSALAEMNHLRIGNTITLTLSQDYVPSDSEAIGNSYDFEIVGIYDVNIPQTADENTAECDITENFIFIGERALRQIDIDISGKKREIYDNGATFFLNEPQDMDAVVDKIKERNGISEESFLITINNKAYNDSALPLARLSGYTNTLVLIIIGISMLLLSLIMTMWIRDRLYEVGILLSIGIKKGSIIGQHMLETLMIMAIAIMIAWPVTGIASNTLGNYLLNAMPIEEEMAQEDGRMSGYNYDPVDVSDVGQIKTLKVQTGGKELAAVVGCSVLIALLSVSVSSIVIFRMKPKDILSSGE